jgi:molybdopterin synthase sulfur carrier subunit
MKLKYFAWVRERIGKRKKPSSRPRACARSTSSSRGFERGALCLCLEKPKVICAAIDHAHQADAVISGACEIAFFLPMTGG